MNLAALFPAWGGYGIADRRLDEPYHPPRRRSLGYVQGNTKILPELRPLDSAIGSRKLEPAARMGKMGGGFFQVDLEPELD